MYVGNHQTMAASIGGHQQPETCVREGEVPGEMKRLANMVDELGMVVEQLAARLNPIRRSVGSQIGKGEPQAPEPVLCEMAAVLRNQRATVERHVAMLRTAMHELEI